MNSLRLPCERSFRLGKQCPRYTAGDLAVTSVRATTVPNAMPAGDKRNPGLARTAPLAPTPWFKDFRRYRPSSSAPETLGASSLGPSASSFRVSLAATRFQL